MQRDHLVNARWGRTRAKLIHRILEQPGDTAEQEFASQETVDRHTVGRDERAGSMFADWELIGVPHRVVLSDRGLAAGEVEYQHRRATEAEKLSATGLADALLKKLAS